MATYHCRVKVGGKGRASGHAAYIAREGDYAQREGYEDLEASGHGNLPAWAKHAPNTFWRAADQHERANGTTYREIEIALPRELDPAQRQALVEAFIRKELGGRHAHQWAIHTPGAALAGGEQPHAHIMYSERTLDGIERDPAQYFKRHNAKHPELGGCRKDSAGTEAQLLETRQRWAEVQNAHLQQHGYTARVDHRSLAEQGIDRQPEQHLGPRRVRQLAPEQREALLERRDAEHGLSQAQQALLAIPLTDSIQELTAQARQRERAQIAALREHAWAYARQARADFQAQWEHERPHEAEPALAPGPESQQEALPEQNAPAPPPDTQTPTAEPQEHEQAPQPRRYRSHDWDMEM